MTQQQRLDEIAARAMAATPGEWRTAAVDIYDAVFSDNHGICRVARYPSTPKDQLDRDTVFIAHARQDIPWLVQQVEELTGTVADLLRDRGAVPQDWEPLAERRRLQEENARLRNALHNIAGATITAEGLPAGRFTGMLLDKIDREAVEPLRQMARLALEGDR